MFNIIKEWNIFVQAIQQTSQKAPVKGVGYAWPGIIDSLHAHHQARLPQREIYATVHNTEKIDVEVDSIFLDSEFDTAQHF